ncbi:flagellar basal-body MS-ring/collar protein FliF [Gemmobacter serpentinus]|uniref:flagellar basal-body MS-ring/collar protein FliF n=1 Tax=Gemmobacter serpentinus TaxID=2652247 RepID=UPI00124E8CBF|nr:flagellar basal-body MS-ring/collar protein FliF [Gemmobacter serpentinus]
MQNLISLWSQWNFQKKAVVVMATLLMFGAILGLSRMAGRTDYALLYAGLEPAAAGQVIAALEQQGVNFEVRGNSIHVEAARRDALRMQLAGEGLPSVAAGGYEILDGLSGFGTTSQMFDAAYWCAREGELARTILATPGIRAARVHIAQALGQPFRREARPSASVTVTTAQGSLSAAQARAFRHLVAAAVPGLLVEDVAVIDSVSGLVQANESGPDASGTDPDRVSLLRRNVERLLVARVGPGNAVVEVSLDLVTDREQVTERRFDPEGRVAISSETQEKSGTNSESAQDVTVASNLPEGDATAGGNSQSQTSETRERTNFEVSETRRELLRNPGGVRRLTIAVLVNDIGAPAPDGTITWQPRPEAELATLRELVASAVGLDETRGDVLTLKSLPFEPVPEQGSLAEAGALSGLGPFDGMALIRMGLLALVTLLLGLFVLRPVLTARAQVGLRDGGQPLALPGQHPEDSGDGMRVIHGEIDDGPFPALSGEAEEVPADPVERLRRLIDQRQAESVEILRGWLETGEERG